MTDFPSVGTFWRHYVKNYESKSYTDFVVKFPWNEKSRDVARSIRKISERRSTNRISNYVNREEIDRVRKRLGKTMLLHEPQGGGMASRKNPSRNQSMGSRNSNKVRDVSIRFGVSKPGHGYGKERGDFCLVSAVLVGKKITFFYRSIELIGGIAFDLVLIAELEKLLEVEFTEVNIWAKKAFIFALKGNSNQKLHPKLKEIMRA